MPSPSPATDQPVAVAPQPAALERQARRLAALPQPPWLHGEIARRLADKLDAIRIQPDHWLDWGAFLGAGKDEVTRRYPQAQRWVLEPSPALLARAQAQAAAPGKAAPWWAGWRRQVTVPPTALGLDDPMPASGPVAGVGLLWANMALHAHPQPGELFAHWHRRLAVDGFLMCSGLGPDTARELTALYQSLGWPRPTVAFIDMHDLGDELAKAGFLDPVMDMERLTLTWPDAAAMLAELRTWGGNAAWGRFPGWRTPRWRDRLLQALQERLQGPDGRLSLTVEVVYGHAVKPAPRALVAEETRVPLADMRRMIKTGGGSRR